jgi:hypothetical protein
VAEVLQSQHWGEADDAIVRFRLAQGWVSLHDAAGAMQLERVTLSTTGSRSRSWSQAASLLQERGWMRRVAVPVEDEPHEAGVGHDGASWQQMLTGEWLPAKAPCYRVPPHTSWMQVRAFIGVNSRRVGQLRTGEVIRVAETQMTAAGVSRMRFGPTAAQLSKEAVALGHRSNGFWVTLRDAEGQALLLWTRASPTRLQELQDPELQASLYDKLREQRAEAEQRRSPLPTGTELSCPLCLRWLQ